MGNLRLRSSDVSKRIIWCDTEGGVRGVPMWDITFIDECKSDAVHAVRFFSVSSAHKAGRAKLRQFVPMSVYANAIKTCTVYMATHTLERHVWSSGEYTAVAGSLAEVVQTYLERRKGCVLCAWNMRAHDKLVLERSVGLGTMKGMVLWDALPWFRSNYTLPKNTLASSKAGTPRNVFKIPIQGQAHTSLADAGHLRELILRAAYCTSKGTDTTSYQNASREDMFEAAQRQIEEQIDVESWVPVQENVWETDLPDSVKGVI